MRPTAGVRWLRSTGPVTLDTGSNGSLGLYRSALGLPGIRAALKTTGTVTPGHRAAQKARCMATVSSAISGTGPIRSTAFCPCWNT